MEYYIKTTLSGDFDATIEKVIEALKTEGFGIITEIDMQAKLKEKLGKNLSINSSGCSPKNLQQRDLTTSLSMIPRCRDSPGVEFRPMDESIRKADSAID